MSVLNALKFIEVKREQGWGPEQAKRQKLCVKIDEQIQMARATQSGSDFKSVKIRNVRDEQTGEMRRVELPKRVKPWWWSATSGKLCVTVRYGARTLEVMPGKNAIEAEDIAGVIAALESVRSAAISGELDARIEEVSTLVKAGFVKEAGTSKRGTLKLPVKSA